MTRLIHVAAAVIEDTQGRIFIAKRPDDKHQGGLWEFPGGKVEDGETAEQALVRELQEEIGISVTDCRPLIQVPYHYPDKSVLLDVFHVTGFEGEAWGKEGQEVAWVAKCQLDSYQFPAANRPILNAALLPDRVLITPECGSSTEVLSGLQKSLLQHHLQGVIFRQKQLSDEAYQRGYALISRAMSGSECLLIAHCPIELANQLHAAALHLTSERLDKLTDRQAFKGRFLGASCHSLAQLQQAVEKGCDYATLSPIAQTQSHPDTPNLGWGVAAEWVKDQPIPVYLLGGLDDTALEGATNIGAQGIAAISAWWR